MNESKFKAMPTKQIVKGESVRVERARLLNF